MRTGLYSDSRFEAHRVPADLPENAVRMQAIATRLRAEPQLLERLTVLPAVRAERRFLTSVHSVDYLARFEAAFADGQRYLHTGECPLSEQTYTVALEAAGSVLDATAKVLSGQLDNVLVAARPPGHHAERAEAMGFCYLNNVALGAEWALSEGGCERVLIFDFDVHHGNGSQHQFAERSEVFYASTHQHPRTCYPGTGWPHERGRGAGLGYTLNVALPPLTQDAAYIARFEAELWPVFQAFRPDCVFLSAGFDAHQDDPLAQLMLTRRSFDHVLRRCKTLVERLGHGRIVSVLEGGYHPQRLAECVASHLRILLEDGLLEDELLEDAPHGGADDLQAGR